MTHATAYMPLLERLRRAAPCVIFLDGAPEPAADVADMLRKAADEIERLRAFIQSLDGKTICIATDGGTFIDDGVIVASDIVQPTTVGK